MVRACIDAYPFAQFLAAGAWAVGHVGIRAAAILSIRIPVIPVKAARRKKKEGKSKKNDAYRNFHRHLILYTSNRPDNQYPRRAGRHDRSWAAFF